jgi:hypothetical protein
MRVLITVLACRALERRLRAVMETWARDVRPPHQLAFFTDTAMVEATGDARAWPCIEAGSPLDRFEGIPVKLRAGLLRARAVDWDWWVKTDDDCYVHVERLLRHLEALDATAPVYVGNGLGSSQREARCAELVPLAGGDFGFHWGFGFAVSRPAFEQMWPLLDVALCRTGARIDDATIGAVAARVRVPFVTESSLYTLLGPTGILRSSGAVGATLEPEDMRRTHGAFAAARAGARALPMIVSARTGWGHVGLDGWLGFDDTDVRVAGRAQPRAISAHAPSRVLLRRRPGELLNLQGAIADTARREGVSATFHVLTAAGTSVAALGRAGRLAPTKRLRVPVPEDGLLALVAEPDQTAWCHAVWLF